MQRKLKIIFITMLAVVLTIGLSLIVLAEGQYNNSENYNLTSFDEAPLLKIKVAANELPPVEERLPDNPVVVEPIEGGEVGVYGGTWRAIWSSFSDKWGLNKHMNYVKLVRLAGDMETFEPDVADWWKVSDDAREYTFHIREGIKWSDGAPLTTDDIMFYFDYVLADEELAFGARLLAGKSMDDIEEVKALDKYTFKITFKEPFGMFLYIMANGGYERIMPLFPGHWYKQFHPEFTTDEELKANVAKYGFEKWQDMFHIGKVHNNVNPDVPSLGPWVLSDYPDNNGYMRWTRNPYYYKVDPEGNQLPYIDNVDWTMYGEKEVALLMAMNGEVDYDMRHFGSGDYTILKANEEKGNYTTIPYPNYLGANTCYFFNFTPEDPFMEKVITDVRFRQAFSLALNRDEINEACFMGLGKPRQAAPCSLSPLSKILPDWADYYADYDPERANKLLDEMGLTEKNSEGFRLRPDGEPLSIRFVTSADPIDEFELVKDYMADIGINFIIENIDRTLFEARIPSGQYDIASWGWSIAASISRIKDTILPGKSAGLFQPWSPSWGKWLDTKGKEGIKPPEYIFKLDELADKVTQTPDTQVRNQYFKEMFKILKENLFIVGSIGEAPKISVKHNRMKNIKDETEMAYGSPAVSPSAPSYIEQAWIDPDLAK